MAFPHDLSRPKLVADGRAGGAQEGGSSLLSGHLVLTLDDVLSRVPTRSLKPGLHDPARELHFEMDELLDGIARGRATIMLSKLAARYPDTFESPSPGSDDTPIYLPLQKLIQQIGRATRRAPEKLVLPATEPAPPIPAPASEATAARPLRKLQVMQEPVDLASSQSPMELPLVNLFVASEPKAAVPARAEPLRPEKPPAAETPPAAAAPVVPPPASVEPAMNSRPTGSRLGEPSGEQEALASHTAPLPKPEPLPPSAGAEPAAPLVPARPGFMESAAVAPRPENKGTPSLPFAPRASQDLTPSEPLKEPAKPVPPPVFHKEPPQPAAPEAAPEPPAVVPPPFPVKRSVETAASVFRPASSTRSEAPLVPPTAAEPGAVLGEPTVRVPTGRPIVRPPSLHGPAGLAAPDPVPASTPAVPGFVFAPRPSSMVASLHQPSAEPAVEMPEVSIPPLFPIHPPPPSETSVISPPAVETKPLTPDLPSTAAQQPVAGPLGPEPQIEEALAAEEAASPEPPTAAQPEAIEPPAEVAPSPGEAAAPETSVPPPAAPVPPAAEAPSVVPVEPTPAPAHAEAEKPAPEPVESAADTQPPPSHADASPKSEAESAPSEPPKPATKPEPPPVEKRPEPAPAEDPAPPARSPKMSVEPHQLSSSSRESAARAHELLGAHFSLSRIDQEPLQAIFMTEEFLDLPRITQLSCVFPGITGCMIVAGDAMAHSGERPAGLDAQALCNLTKQLSAVALALPKELPAVQTYTIHIGTRALSVFTRAQVSLCLVHSHRGFLPGVRERVAAVADTLSRGITGEPSPE